MSLYWGSEYELTVSDRADPTENGGVASQADRFERAVAELGREITRGGITRHVEILELPDSARGSDASLRLRIRLRSAGKETNLRRILEAASERDRVVEEVRVRRLRTLKRSDEAPGYSPFL